MYALHTKGVFKVDKDGAVLVKAEDGYYDGYVFSVPPNLLPSLIHVFRVRCGHPSQMDLAELLIMAR